MKRRLFTIASLIAAFVLVATTGWWIDSYRYMSQVHCGAISVISSRGSIMILLDLGGPIQFGAARSKDVLRRIPWLDLTPVPMGSRFEVAQALFSFHGEKWAFKSTSRTKGSIVLRRYYGLMLPHWFVVLLLAIVPVTRFIYSLRRSPPGSCINCGYDLRASKECCPECGAAIEASLDEPECP